MTIRALSIFGTRPEAIKMAPIVRRLAAHPGFTSHVCVTAQHREMLDQVLEIFSIEPDYDLNVMRQGQDLSSLTGRILTGIRDVLRADKPDIVLVQGDTTTCMAAALAAFYEHIPIGHVEAGLRSGRLDAPFPEEANRSIVSRIADLHFAPTEKSRANLREEGIPDERIVVTGNTVIDALLQSSARVSAYPAEHWQSQLGPDLSARLDQGEGKVILVTGHRRENFGQGMEDLCRAIRDMALTRPDWLFIYPVHLNPQVQGPVNAILSGLANVFLIAPMDYLSFVWLMNRADLLLTDSGGIQEEAPSLGKPVLVMRDVTERTEAVAAGTVRLVGTNRRSIQREVECLLTDPASYLAMANATNPYGTGRSAEEIVTAMERWSLARLGAVPQPAESWAAASNVA